MEVLSLSAVPHSKIGIDVKRFVNWPDKIGFFKATVFHFQKERLGMRKIGSRWVPHHLKEMQKWLQYDTARIHLECYEREGETSLHLINTMDEI